MKHSRPFPTLLRATAFALTCVAGAAVAADEPALTVLGRRVINESVETSTDAAPGYRIRLTLAILRGAGWSAGTVVEAAKRALRILHQCGIRAATLEVTEFAGPSRYRTFSTPVARELAARLALPRPAVFFLAESGQSPAFDAEAVGRGNSGSRPEMADTVWVVAGARDLDVVIAHELVHVLTDSGVHAQAIGNLMREDTAPEATQLSAAQCEAVVTTARRNGLIQPLGGR
ncbi:MAG: hypothetical protein ABI630_10650 [Betaproteobacteria bacterium]